MLAVGGRSGEFTSATLRQVAEDVSALSLDGIGHYAAMEAPNRLADGLLSFYEKLDNRSNAGRPTITSTLARQDPRWGR
ncbi:MAG: hypothetical protein ACJ736_26065 [Streptomyces sp.]